MRCLLLFYLCSERPLSNLRFCVLFDLSNTHVLGTKPKVDNLAIPKLIWPTFLRSELEIQKPGDHPRFQEKCSRSEKAILGALGELRGILGAALRIRNSILGIRNSILGMASHDLSNTKTTLGATPGAIPGIDGNPHESDFHLPQHSRSFLFKNWGGPRAPEKWWPSYQLYIRDLSSELW